MLNTISECSMTQLTPEALLQVSSDIALLLDNDGQVLDVSINDAALSDALKGDWRGQRWEDTVTEESKEKIVELLEGARKGAAPSWRHVNHPSARHASDRPIRYCAMRIDGSERYLAVGRDLQNVADLQQQLITAQETAERDFWRLRQSESRFRLLFQICRSPVFVVDAQAERVLEVNPAAEKLLSAERKMGRLSALFEDDSAETLRFLLARAISTGHSEQSGLFLKDDPTAHSVSVSSLRQGNSGIYLVMLIQDTESIQPTDPAAAQLVSLMAGSPDGIVICDESGRVLSANPAFVELAQLPSYEVAVGKPLGNWLGNSSVDVNVLYANIRRSGYVRLYGTEIRGAHGISATVEVAGTLLDYPDCEGKGYGFIIRSTDQRVVANDADLTHTRSVEQLTALVGKVPLKELVRESADLIERLSIEAALTLTSNNRAAAAEMLGLSRQSLYVKLKRYDIGVSDNDNDNDND